MDWRELAYRLMGKPDAYSRITRTPIYNKPSLAPTLVGAYVSPGFMKTPGIQVPDLQSADGSTIRHESAHAIYDQAGLKQVGRDLASHVPAQIHSQISSNPVYGAGTADQMANEGLGFSVESPDPAAGKYVDYAASKISDPALRDRLLRLHSLAGLGSR